MTVKTVGIRHAGTSKNAGTPTSDSATGGQLCVGIDVAEIKRIAALPERYPDQIGSIFTDRELAQARSAPHPDETYAVCFAAKEAVGKALGTGLAGIDWTDIEAYVRPGHLEVILSGRAQQRAAADNIRAWVGSWCRIGHAVLVCVVGN